MSDHVGYGCYIIVLIMKYSVQYCGGSCFVYMVCVDVMAYNYVVRDNSTYHPYASIMQKLVVVECRSWCNCEKGTFVSIFIKQIRCTVGCVGGSPRQAANCIRVR